MTVEIPELKISKKVTTDADGYAAFEVKAKPVYWSPENPKLYAVRIAAETDSVDDRIGFRTIETRGTKILLNGREVFCRGVSIHEEMPYGMSGRAFSAEHARILLGWAKEMGCNFVRLAHYPHNEAMVRAAEEMGLMVWSEIPVYWTIQWENPATYANAEAQLADMITRDRNRANVVVWSVANETPHGEARLKFLRSLIAKARSMDGTRLVSAAMEKTRLKPDLLTVKDDLADLVDLISFNQYVGWYDGESEKCDRVNWTFDLEKPVFISEFGGGAVYGRHGARTERFTEEYMEDLYERSVNMFRRMPGLAGTARRAARWSAFRTISTARASSRTRAARRKPISSCSVGMTSWKNGISSAILPENTLRRPVIAGRFFSVPVAEFSRNFVSCRMDRETEYA